MHRYYLLGHAYQSEHRHAMTRRFGLVRALHLVPGTDVSRGVVNTAIAWSLLRTGCMYDVCMYYGMYSTSKPHARRLTSSSGNVHRLPKDPSSCPPRSSTSMSLAYTDRNRRLHPPCGAVDVPGARGEGVWGGECRWPTTLGSRTVPA